MLAGQNLAELQQWRAAFAGRTLDSVVAAPMAQAVDVDRVEIVTADAV